MRQSLFDNYSYRFCDLETAADFIKCNYQKVFPDDTSLLEFPKIDNKLNRYNLLIYHNTEVVGWSVGIQKSPTDFYMINTGILPAHQNKGLYKIVLVEILEHLLTAGFKYVFSKHLITDNRIIICKLRYGFTIKGVDFNPKFGSMLVLGKYL